LSISFSARVAAAPDVMFRLVGEESVLLDLKNNRYMGLNAVGTRMWNMLIGSESIQHAFDSLLAEYDVPADLLRQDVDQFLTDLLEQGLVQINAP
jgi:hypothetical protein